MKKTSFKAFFQKPLSKLTEFW